jgi:hypothetical protein
MLAESRKHPVQKILLSIPTLGPVRVAVLMAVVQTPHRFRATGNSGPTPAWAW